MEVPKARQKLTLTRAHMRRLLIAQSFKRNNEGCLNNNQGRISSSSLGREKVGFSFFQQRQREWEIRRPANTRKPLFKDAEKYPVSKCQWYMYVLCNVNYVMWIMYQSCELIFQDWIMLVEIDSSLQKKNPANRKTLYSIQTHCRPTLIFFLFNLRYHESNITV